MFSIQEGNVIRESRICQGSFGQIYPYRSEDDPRGNKWAIKILEVASDDIPRIIQEIALTFKSKHNNVLPIESFDIKPCKYRLDERKSQIWNVFLKLPRMIESLSDKIKRHTPENRIPEPQILRHFHDVACGLAYLHDEKILHMDIKPANLLCDKDGTTKITDFGVSKYLADEMEEFDLIGGTAIYMAPEILEIDRNPKKDEVRRVDLWCLGMTMLELCALKKCIASPWNTPQRFKKIGQSLDTLKGIYSDSLIDLLSKLLKSNPYERIGLNELKIELENLIAVSNKIEIMEEEQDDMIVNSQVPKKRGPGELRDEEVNDTEGNLSTVKDQMKKCYRKSFMFETEQTGKSLKIQQRDTNLTEELLQEMMGRLVKELDQANISNLQGLEALAINMERSHQIGDTSIKNLSSYFDSNFQCLRQLELSFSGCERITDSGLKDLASQIGSNLLNVNHLNLNFSNCLEISDSGIRGFASGIGPNLGNISKLYLNFSNCHQIAEGLGELTSQIGSYLKKLEELHLDFSECNQIRSPGFEKLVSQEGPSLVDLKQLQLSFAMCKEMRDSGFKDLITQIGLNIKNLQKLRLDFSGCQKITDSSIEDLVSHIGSNSHVMNDMKLIFAGCWKISDKNVRNLAVQIGKSLESLQKLQLDFSACHHITDNSFKELTSQIGTNLKSLNHLELNFSGCSNVTNEGLKHLTTQFNVNLKNLKQLQLNLACIDMMESNFMELVSEMGLKLQQLNQLRLDFSECSAISDSSLKVLGSSLISKLKKLKHLELKFYKCQKVTDTGISELAAQISLNAEKLQGLELNFSSCKQITDTGIKELASQLGPNFKKLFNFSLDFSECYEITDSCLKKLGSQIGTNLKNLRYLLLHFAGCDEITEIGIKELARQIGPYLKRLMHFRLDLTECQETLNLGFPSPFEINPGSKKLELSFKSPIFEENLHDLLFETFSHISQLELR